MFYYVPESGSLSLPEQLIHPDLNSLVREHSLYLGSDSKILSQLLCPPSLLVSLASCGHIQKPSGVTQAGLLCEPVVVNCTRASLLGRGKRNFVGEC